MPESNPAITTIGLCSYHDRTPSQGALGRSGETSTRVHSKHQLAGRQQCGDKQAPVGLDPITTLPGSSTCSAPGHEGGRSPLPPEAGDPQRNGSHPQFWTHTSWWESAQSHPSKLCGFVIGRHPTPSPSTANGDIDLRGTLRWSSSAPALEAAVWSRQPQDASSRLAGRTGLAERAWAPTVSRVVTHRVPGERSSEVVQQATVRPSAPRHWGAETRRFGRRPGTPCRSRRRPASEWRGDAPQASSDERFEVHLSSAAAAALPSAIRPGSCMDTGSVAERAVRQVQRPTLLHWQVNGMAETEPAQGLAMASLTLQRSRRPLFHVKRLTPHLALPRI
jgi:hypothetical protein